MVVSEELQHLWQPELALKKCEYKSIFDSVEILNKKNRTIFSQIVIFLKNNGILKLCIHMKNKIKIPALFFESIWSELKKNCNDYDTFNKIIFEYVLILDRQ